jgi:hypothetical protein
VEKAESTVQNNTKTTARFRTEQPFIEFA